MARLIVSFFSSRDIPLFIFSLVPSGSLPYPSDNATCLTEIMGGWVFGWVYLKRNPSTFWIGQKHNVNLTFRVVTLVWTSPFVPDLLGFDKV